jgi:NAD(P)-dependent dehydrogenase (short-subunit alcohol dehydrogenase family)
MTSQASRRVAVVTGASQGIGAGAAESFREAGYAWWACRGRSALPMHLTF